MLLSGLSEGTNHSGFWQTDVIMQFSLFEARYDVDTVPESRPSWSFTIHHNIIVALHPSVWRRIGCKHESANLIMQIVDRVSFVPMQIQEFHFCPMIGQSVLGRLGKRPTVHCRFDMCHVTTTAEGVKIDFLVQSI